MALTSRRIGIGTRASRMALSQTARVQALLQAQHPDLHFEVVTVNTRGDAQPARALQDFRRPGIFTSSLEQALCEREVDIAVHAYKDLPIRMAPELALAAVLPRDDPGDALVTRGHVRLAALPAGARIGTSSPRRARMVRSLRQDWQVVPIRGNVDTRIGKLADGTCDGIIVAACGLYRLGLEHRIVHRFDLCKFLTAPAQGAVALQCLASDRDIHTLLQTLHHEPTHLATAAERGLLYHLGGGCALPTAAFAHMEADRIVLRGRIWSPDGQQAIGGSVRGHDPDAVSQQLAQYMITQGCQAWL